MEKELTLKIRAKNLATRTFEEVKSGLNKLDKSLSSLAKTVFSVKGALGGLIAVLGARELGQTLVKAGTDLETFRTQLQALYQGNVELAEQALQAVIQFAEKTPFYTKDVVNAFIMLEAAGIKVSSKLLKTLGDTAYLFNRDISEVANALISMETEVWRRLGVVIDRTGKKAVISSGNIRMEVENTIASIRAGVVELLEKRFSGAMEKAEGTYIGVMRILGSIWDIFWMKVTESGVWDYIKAVFQTLLDYINRFREQGKLDVWAKSISNALIIAFKTGVESIGVFIRAIDVLRSAWNAAKGVIALALSTVAAGLSKVLGGLSKVVGVFRKDWAQSLKKASEDLQIIRTALVETAVQSLDASKKYYNDILKHERTFDEFQRNVESAFQRNIEMTQRLQEVETQRANALSESNLKLLEQQDLQYKKEQELAEEREKFEEERLKYFEKIKEEMMSKSELYAKKMEEEIEKYARTEEEKMLVRKYYEEKIAEARAQEIEQEKQAMAERLGVWIAGNKELIDATTADLEYLTQKAKEFSKIYGEELAKPMVALLAGIDMAINEIPKKNEIIMKMGKDLVENLHEGFKGMFKGLVTEGIGGFKDAWKQMLNSIKNTFIDTFAELAASRALHALKWALIKLFEDVLKSRALIALVKLLENVFGFDLSPHFDFLKMPTSALRPTSLPIHRSFASLGASLFAPALPMSIAGISPIETRPMFQEATPPSQPIITTTLPTATYEAQPRKPTTVNLNVKISTWDSATMTKVVKEKVIPNLIEDIRNYGALRTEIVKVTA